MPGKIHFIDVTNRDGVQAARVILSKFQKTMLNYHLSKFGVARSEVGFPFLSHEQNYIKGNLELAKEGVFGNMILQGWCRGIPQDVEQSLPAGMEHLNLSVSVSDQMITHKYSGRRARDQVVRDMVAGVAMAREAGIKTIGVNAEDASRTDMEFLVEFTLAAKEAGAERLRYCDTLGCDTPQTIYERMHTLTQRSDMDMELHAHNDLGLAVANSVAGAQGVMDAGRDAYINTTVNGIGERAGQADLVTTVLAIRFGQGMKKYEIGDPVDLKTSWKLAKYVSYAFQLPIPMNQPGVGANAFAHESGIHADGTLKDRYNYELYDFELLGRGEDDCIPTGRVITTGEYGGVAGFKHVYEQFGMPMTDGQETLDIFTLVQHANIANQVPLTDDELRFIARHPKAVRTILTLVPA
ncbi:MAG: homocitrate synthase [Chloroflexi bacterium]|nr:homocitrate synthase [Chloroflexota bacterium]